MLDKMICAARKSLDVKEAPVDDGAARAHLGQVFMLETRFAQHRASGKDAVGFLQEARVAARLRQSSHNLRMSIAESVEDRLGRNGHIALARSETLYGIADTLLELLREMKPLEEVDSLRAMTIVAARAANNAAMINEVRGLVALRGIECLMERTRLDRMQAEDLLGRAGADLLFEEFLERRLTHAQEEGLQRAPSLC